MRVLLLAPASSVHTQRIASSLAARGFRVGVATYHQGEIAGVDVFNLLDKQGTGKLGYLAAIPRLRRLIGVFRPDVLHAHYLSSYGTAGSLCGFRPFAVSAWGTDVFDFPRRGPFNRWLVSRTLARADLVMSTSRFMAKEVARYTPKGIVVTPFGVDTRAFRPFPKAKVTKEAVIGTVKALEPRYGMETVLRAFAQLASMSAYRGLRLEIVGRGSQEADLRSLAESLGVKERVEFAGFVGQGDLPGRMNRFSVAAYGSICQESFGVSLLESQACGVPVVASDVGGFSEVVRDGATGILVPPGDHSAMAAAIGLLLDDPALRWRFSREARRFVSKEFPWERTVESFIGLYRRLSESH